MTIRVVSVESKVHCFSSSTVLMAALLDTTANMKRVFRDMVVVGPDRPHRPPPITAGGENRGDAPRFSVIDCGLGL